MGVINAKTLIDPTLANRVQREYGAKQPAGGPAADPYRDLKVLKRFKGGMRAADVCLLERDIVRKTYKIDKESQRRFFWHEIGILTRLKGCPFVPQIVHVDAAKGLLYETYCGGPCPNTSKNRATARKRIEELRDKWGVERVRGRSMFSGLFGEFPSRDGGRSLNNFTMRNKTVCVIDFGGDGWRLNPVPRSYPGPRS